jgi:hypothetical protein
MLPEDAKPSANSKSPPAIFHHFRQPGSLNGEVATTSIRRTARLAQPAATLNGNAAGVNRPKVDSQSTRQG